MKNAKTPDTDDVYGTWGILHNTWTACVGRPKYDKKAWQALETRVLAAVAAENTAVKQQLIAEIVQLFTAQDGKLVK